MNYFTEQNTEGFTKQELAKLNQRVAQLLVGINEPTADDVKNACDRANNEFIAHNW